MRHVMRFFVSALIAALLALPALAQQDVISTVIGGGPSDMPAVDADINGPVGVAFDSAGNYYFTSYGQNRVFKVNTSGLLTVLAGNGLAGYAGDGVTGGAASAELNGPYSVTVDSSDNVYIADYNNFVIRKVNTTTNTITTFLGTQGSCGGSTSLLCYPQGVAVDSTSTNLFIADTEDCQIKKVVLERTRLAWSPAMAPVPLAAMAAAPRPLSSIIQRLSRLTALTTCLLPIPITSRFGR